jgi:cytosine/adenosine deaminase-related metal-dependent hydrolase
MRRLSAQYVITNTGAPAKRAVISAEDDGTIISIEPEIESLRDPQSVEFFNGIIVPGFINCHCHLELSHMKGSVAEGTGLENFIMHVRDARNNIPVDEISAAQQTDNLLSDEGVVLCADVCNTSLTFNIKKKSRIQYHNFLEVFGIDPQNAGKRIDEIAEVAVEADSRGLAYSITPHSAYSVSLPLFQLIREKSIMNRVTSIHFMESPAEKHFLSDHIFAPADHASAILDEVTRAGNLILVHNTFTDVETVNRVKKRGRTYWCLCPGSNMYIEKKMPPVDMLMTEGCNIVIGTDSLASNRSLSILAELKLIQNYFPSIPLQELIRWSTINGAEALGEDNNFGKIEPGKKPGLLLLENTDLLNFKLLPETTVTRLV